MPSDETSDHADLAFQAKLQDRGANRVLAVAALVVIGLVAINLLPSSDDVSDRSVAVSPGPSLAIADTPTPTETPYTTAVDLSPLTIPWRDLDIHLTAPTDWSWSEARAALCSTAVGDCRETNNPSLTVHDVTRVVTDACPSGELSEVPFKDVGPTVEDMTGALLGLAGATSSGATEVSLGYHRATRFVLTLADQFSAECGGPEGRWLWEDDDGSHFGLLKGGVATIYVVDVGGERLVIATHYRGASAKDVAQLDAIVASIAIKPMPRPIPSPQCALRRLPTLGGSTPYLTVGMHSLTVECVEVSFHVPTFAWEVFRGLYITKSSDGPQDAEAIIFWTAFAEEGWAARCAKVLNPSDGSSAAALAKAVAGAPGTELVAGPTEITLRDERPATYVALKVREDLGCDPGYFYSWDSGLGGAFWVGAEPGDTIRVWVVDVDGTMIFIEAATKPDAGDDLEREVEQIVASTEFPSP
jgi:hypothetical protein